MNTARKVVNTRNRQLSQNVYMTLDTRHTDLNNNILIIGGSGCGKTFRIVKPNIMQMSSSYIITDPKGEICRDTAGFLKNHGYNVKALNLEDLKKSTHYNQFKYIKSDIDLVKLIGNLIKNTTPKGTNPSDPFWEKAEGMLLQALFQYVWRIGVYNEKTKKVEHNVRAVMTLLNKADFKEDPRTGAKMDSELDKIFNELEAQEPDHPAVKKYNKVMRGAADTVRSIIISANSRLEPVDNEDILELLDDDEIDIDSLGTQKSVLYCVIPDSDDSYNFLVGLLYTQIFQQLYYTADHIYGGALPVHVTFLLDEFANVALPDGYCSLLSTMRSRSISSIIIIQNMAQIKALFEKTYETIQGNCDTLIFLGSNEQQTQKYVSEMMGKQTIYKRSNGLTKGKQGSSSVNEDALGREVMLPDEIRKLKRNECIILVNGYDPVKDKKIDTINHPYFKELCVTSKKYSFDARLERKYGPKNESSLEFVPLSKVNHLQAIDNIAIEEWKKEKYICEKIGKEEPKKPIQRVINVTAEQLLSLDLDAIEREASMGTDFSTIFTEELMQKNKERLDREDREFEEEKRRNNIDIKSELKSSEDTKLYLRLKKEGFHAEVIREILRLSHESSEYTDEIILNYFTPEMDLNEVKECIELLIV